MWAVLLEKFGAMFFTYVVMPLFSKAIVSITKYFQDKKAEDERNKAIDDAVKRYEEAPDAQAQKQAFRDLIRSRTK